MCMSLYVCLYDLAQTPILQDPNGHLLYMCMCMSVYVCVCLYVLVQTPILQDPNGDLLYMLCIAGAIIILGMNRAIHTKPSTENWSGCYIIRLYPTISPVHYTAPMLSARAWMLMGGNW